MGIGRFIIGLVAADQISKQIDRRRQSQKRANPHGPEFIQDSSARFLLLLTKILYYGGGILVLLIGASFGGPVLLVTIVFWFVLHNRYIFPAVGNATLGQLGEIIKAGGYDGPKLDDDSILNRIRCFHSPVSSKLPQPIWYLIKFAFYPITALIWHVLTSIVWLIQYLIPSKETKINTLEYKRNLSRNLAEMQTGKIGKFKRTAADIVKVFAQIFIVIPIWYGIITAIL